MVCHFMYIDCTYTFWWANTYSRDKRMKSFEKIDLEGNNLMDNDLPKTFSTFNTFSDFDFSSMMRGQSMAQAVTQL